MKQKCVLITGVCGETGSYLAEECLRHNEIVIGVDNLFKGTIENISECLPNDNFVFIKGDLTTIELNPCLWWNIGSIFSNVLGNSKLLTCNYDTGCVMLPKIDEIYNLGAVVETRHFYESPHLTYKVNCEGAIRLFDLARSTGVKKFVNASSSEIYGHGSNSTLVITDAKWKETEKSVYDSVDDSTRWSYAHGKILTEYYMNYYKDEIEVCHLRYANCYGPRDLNEEHIIPLLISKSLKGEVCDITKNPSRFYRSYLYMTDAAEATYLAMQNMKTGEAYNIGTDEPISVEDLIDTIIHVFKSEFLDYYNELILRESISRPGDPTYRCLNSNKAFEQLGWSPSVKLEDGIRNTIKAMIDKR